MEKRVYLVSGLRPAISDLANQLLRTVDVCDGAFVAFNDRLVITYKEQATDVNQAIQYIKDAYEKLGCQDVSIIPEQVVSNIMSIKRRMSYGR